MVVVVTVLLVVPVAFFHQHLLLDWARGPGVALQCLYRKIYRLSILPSHEVREDPTPGPVEAGPSVPRAPPPVVAFTAEGPIVALPLLLLDRVWASRVTTSRVNKTTSIVVGMLSPLRTILRNQWWKRLHIVQEGSHMSKSQSHLVEHFRLPSYQRLRLHAPLGNNLQVLVAMLLRYKKCPLRMISRPTTSVEKKTCCLLCALALTTSTLDTSTLRSISRYM